jgi:putative RecB family exonuclease
LSTLSDCPRRYAYRYVEKKKESFQGIEAFVGTLVHDALGWLYLEREAGRTPDADEVVERYRADWDAKHGPSVLVVRRGGHADDYRREGEQMIRAHHAGDFAEDRLETLAIEPKVDVDLRGQSYVGFIDRLARDPSTGRMRIIDFKTGKRMPASMEAAGLQVRGYGLAVLEEHGGLEIDLEYSYLRHGKRLEETMRRAETHAVAEEIGDLIDEALEAEAAGDFPAQPSMLCAWCGFRDVCEASEWRMKAEAVEGGDCPRCGAELRTRHGRNGSFLGCSGYPDCRFTCDAPAGGRP